ncbi:MAG: serine protease Do [Mariniblastus sp.]|jgi:serine protease Do
MDSRRDPDSGPEQEPSRDHRSLPQPSRPKVVFSNEVSPPSTRHQDPTSDALPADLTSETHRPDEQSPNVSTVRDQPATIAPAIGRIPEDPERPPIAPAKSQPTESENHGSGGMGGLYFLLATSALMFGVWFMGPKLVEEYHYAAAQGETRANYENASAQLERQPLANVSYAYQMVAQKIRPSVVSVNAIQPGNDGRGLGSGVIMNTEGYILTNAHVLEGATRILIELNDRRRFTAKLIGIDAISDLALLKINAPNLIPATWGDSDKLEVGSIVWAIGSPYGFQQTVTSGIISGKDRPGDKRHKNQSLLQTDAAVNPGNSGGPLVDAQGQVIGINTSIYGETFQGISFAVPSSTAKFVFQELLDHGKVVRGYLGASPVEVDHRDALRMQLPDLDGAKLSWIEPNSPAENAGIRAGDIIRRWNGTEIKEFRDLYQLAGSTPPDTLVKVSLLRDGEEQHTEVVVGEQPIQLRLGQSSSQHRPTKNGG